MYKTNPVLAFSSVPSEFKKENTDLKNHCTFLSYYPIRTFFTDLRAHCTVYCSGNGM